MAEVKSPVVFKQYSQQQSLLLPPSLEELIGERHLVRVINEVVESMDISDLINMYQGVVRIQCSSCVQGIIGYRIPETIIA